MRKIISSILMTVVLLANLFAPVSVGWGDKKIEVVKNIASAEVNAKLNVEYDYNNSEVEGTVTISDDVDLFDFNVNEDGKTEVNSFFIVTQITNKNKPDIVLEEKERELRNPGSTIDFSYSKLVSGQSYDIKVFLVHRNIIAESGEMKETVLRNYSSSFTAKNSGEEDFTTVTDFKAEEGGQIVGQSGLPACTIWRGAEGIMGCLAQGIYYLIFMPSSVLFALAGTFFDNTFAYSVNDSSYRSAFVVQGWNVVRDFCNMFFIFVLLYIAFKTILDLNGAKTKEMIINVVIIGLLINFSLFATRVIIDVSNVLARVFYNSNTIQITALDDDGSGNEVTDEIARMNKTGVLPLSSALVNKVNPQSLIINAKEYGEIPDKAGMGDTTKNAGGITTGTFIFITLLASGINIVGFIVFLSVGLIFVLRVVMLWLAMIFAPFAFFSYTIPKMQTIPFVGLDKWWPETLSMAFLAPVFIFFLYLILQFLEVGLGITDLAGKEGMLNKLVSIVIPFAFIMVLLMKAKSIAVKMSGEMGAAVAKAGSTVGGLALGAGVGLGAMAMRGTIGKYAGNVANDEELKKKAEAGDKWAKTKLRLASGVSKSSFDARNTILGKQAQDGLGVDMTKGPKFIKPAEGGYAGAQERKVKKKIEDAKLLELSPEAAKKQDEAARNDPTGNTLTAAQENQRRKSAYAKTLGNSDAAILASKELTKEQLSIVETKKAVTALKNTEKELDKINDELDKIGRSLGVDADKLTKENITEYMKNTKMTENLSAYDSEIIKWTATLNKNPKDPIALKELTRVNIEKNKLQEEISDTKSLLSNKETFVNRESQLKEKLKSR